jgi:hypothetical protein
MTARSARWTSFRAMIRCWNVDNNFKKAQSCSVLFSPLPCNDVSTWQAFKRSQENKINTAMTSEGTEQWSHHFVLIHFVTHHQGRMLPALNLYSLIVEVMRPSLWFGWQADKGQRLTGNQCILQQVQYLQKKINFDVTTGSVNWNFLNCMGIRVNGWCWVGGCTGARRWGCAGTRGGDCIV